MFWLVLPTTTSLLPCSPPLAPAPRHRAAVLRMSSDPARAAWLAKQESPAWGPSAPSNDGRERRSAEDLIADQQREREEARKRMLDAMGGSSDHLSRGAGAAFGYFAADTEDYGMGSESSYPEKIIEEIDLATGIPLQGVMQQPTPGTGGFGGRSQGWRRNVEVVDPSGPRPENSLRGPGAGVAVQNYLYDFTPDAETQQAANEFKEERRVVQQEDDLLDALKGAFE
tara:strand:+ start:116 stop:796 length:681 start_codon:yes stop_codon:yes gene_type:complete